MKNFEIKLNVFDRTLKYAIENLRKNELVEAYKLIVDAMSLNPDAPEPHNLIGIWFELTGNDQSARKHYRVAYVLDTSYKPACINLERVSTIFLSKKIPFCFGDEPEQEELNEKRNVNDTRK